MDFFNIAPDLARLPPEETHIVSLDVKPYEDNRRIHILLEITPFQQPPFIEFTIIDPQGNEAGSASIIEPPRWKHELTMHIKLAKLVPGEFKLITRLFYPDIEKQDIKAETFIIPDIN